MTRQISTAQKKICLACGMSVAILTPLLFNPFTSQPVEAVKGWFFEILTLVVLAGLVVTHLSRGKSRGDQAGAATVPAVESAPLSKERSYLVPAMGYLAILGLATVFSIRPVDSLWGAETRQGTLFTACLVIFFLIIAETVRSVDLAEGLVSGILIGSVPVALYGCAQYFGLDPLTWKTSSLSQVHSTTGYSLYLGAYLAMVIPFAYARLLGGTGSDWYKREYPYIFILAIQICCLLFTLSRGAVIALVAGCIVFIVLIIPSNQRWKLSASVFMFVLAGIFWLLSITYGWSTIPLTNNSRINRTDIYTTRLFSNADRLTVWSQTLPMITASPLFGYGPDTFSATYASFYPASIGNQDEKISNWDAHNLFLNQLMSTGILGLLAFGWILLIYYRGVYAIFSRATEKPARLLAAALLASTTAYLVQAQFNPGGMVATVIFWLVLGIGGGLSQRV